MYCLIPPNQYDTDTYLLPARTCSPFSPAWTQAALFAFRALIKNLSGIDLWAVLASFVETTGKTRH